MKELITKLYNENSLTKNELLQVVNYSLKDPSYLFEKAWQTSRESYGDSVYIRGLVEFSNYCKQNCKYCGIRKDNKKVERYHLNKEEILSCIDKGLELGFQSFVLQSGEDFSFTASSLVDIIKSIKQRAPHSALALSIGERDYETYKMLSEAGGNRFLLRHESSNAEIYQNMHPNMTFDNRVKCLKDLRKAGFNIGAGFLVGLPNQTIEDLANDLIFLKELKPEMVGLGPFISHPDTPLKDFESGSLQITYVMLAMVRLLLPYSLIPATTAVSTLNKQGRTMAFRAGANVVMPNLSPDSVKKKYELYKNKAGLKDSSEKALESVKKVITEAGLVPDMGRGDPKKSKKL